MKKKIMAILWVLAVLLGTFVGFGLRYTNDNNNKAVMICSDFDEVLKLEQDLKQSKIDIMTEQKGCGMSFTSIDIDNLTKYISDLKSSKVNPILKVKSTDKLEDCEKAVKEFGIKYIIFDGNTILGYPEKINDMAKIITDNNIIFAVEENWNQIGLVEKKGQKELIEKTNYSINRRYKVGEEYLAKLSENKLFYRLERGVVDRSIRFVQVNQLRNKNLSVSENYEQTNNAILKLRGFLKELKYNINTDIVKLSATKLNINFYFLVMMILTITCIRYIKEIITLKWQTLVCAALTIVVAFSYIEDLGLNIEKSLALVTTMIFSSLATLSVIKITRTDTKRMMLKGILKFLGINILGGYVIVSCLSSLQYTMNIDMYRGVKVSFIVPILMYIVNFVSVYEIKFDDVKQYIKKMSKRSIILTSILLLSVVAIYILRSGSYEILGASKIELIIRESLENSLGIRPRTKEFFLGYPLIMLFIYFRDNKSNLLKFILGFGTAICSASILNSFCHVFTSIEVSMTRSIYGCILGVLIGFVTIRMVKNPNIRVFLTNNMLVKKIVALYNVSGNTKN